MTPENSKRVQFFYLDTGEVVKITSSSTELVGIPEDSPIMERAKENWDRLDAERDQGLFTCTTCGRKIEPGEGFVSNESNSRDGKRLRTPERHIYCVECARRNGSIG